MACTCTCWTWYTANVACIHMEFLFLYLTQDLTYLLLDILSWTLAEKFHINSRSYLFAVHNILSWALQLKRNSISVYIHVLFYSICCHFFLFVFLISGNIPRGPASILCIFFYSLRICITPQVAYFTWLVWLHTIL